MKKLFISALALVMLVGCGGSKKSTETVCSGTLGGQEASINLKFDENDALTGLTMDMKVDAGSKEAAEMALGLLEGQKETMLSGFGEGADATFEVEDTVVVVKVTFDVSKNKDLAGVDIDGSKAEIVKAFEDAGLTCK